MKAILKTLPQEFEFKIDETFTSETNNKIRRKLIPELLKAMVPRYRPTYDQLNYWLKFLHKHRRSRYNYLQKGNIDRDNRRLHGNNRLNEVSKLLINVRLMLLILLTIRVNLQLILKLTKFR